MTERDKLRGTIEYDSLDMVPELENAVTKAIAAFYGLKDGYVMHFDTQDRLALMRMAATFITDNWPTIKE